MTETPVSVIFFSVLLLGCGSESTSMDQAETSVHQFSFVQMALDIDHEDDSVCTDASPAPGAVAIESQFQGTTSNKSTALKDIELEAVTMTLPTVRSEPYLDFSTTYSSVAIRIFIFSVILLAGLLVHHAPAELKRFCSEVTSEPDFLPRIFVGCSALLIAVATMEVNTVELFHGMSSGLLVMVLSTVAAILHIVQLLLTTWGPLCTTETENPWFWHAVHGLLAGNTPLLALISIEKLGLSRAYAILFTAPLWTALITKVFARAPWTNEHICVTLACTIGVFLLVNTDQLLSGASYPLDGLLSACCFSIFSACAVVIANTKLRAQSPAMLSLCMMSSGAICAAIVLVMQAQPVFPRKERTLDSTFSQSFFALQATLMGGLIAIVNELCNASFCQSKNTDIANMFYLELTFSTIICVHDYVSAKRVAGSIIILISTLLSLKLPKVNGTVL